MVAVAVGWQIYSLTHSTFALGMVGLVQFLPLVLLLLVVGHVADRFNRKTILASCQIVRAVALGILSLTTFLGHLHPVGIFCAAAVIGAAQAFEGPATHSLVPALVEEQMVPQAIAWSTSAFQTASIVGPAIGGLLYVFGAYVPYAAGAVLCIAASVFSLSLQPRHIRGVKIVTAADSIFSGFHYIRDHKNILGAISLDLFAVMLGGATALLPAYAHDILHTGPAGLGLLRLAPAVGALLTSVFLARRSWGRRAGFAMFAGVIVFGLATAGFAVSHYLWLSVALLVVSGGADVVSVVIRASLVQLETPDAMRGRVGAVNALFVGTSNELGEFESGVTAAWFGLIPATVIGGMGSVVVALIWMRLFPGLRKLECLNRG
jgi:MFS family permease